MAVLLMLRGVDVIDDPVDKVEALVTGTEEDWDSPAGEGTTRTGALLRPPDPA